jgi:hypothetical protein
MTCKRITSRADLPPVIAKIMDGYQQPNAFPFVTEKGHFFISHPAMTPVDIEQYVEAIKNHPFGPGVLYLPITGSSEQSVKQAQTLVEKL